ncbi:HNH endonuclease [Arthrobacter sp. zg-Y859]|uniref:HNH endonuclease n=2 Tax=Arthrobacter jinronghuae TaxID=2964609 RepID=A0ABT1NT05_9MICC|nr:HNH endonuclease signature motif containing protein [Arthrobacter jinronghuae]MCQ1950818.1 HNH endonuclease [Arthrobacter jinronghuae]UWX79286.1 HNH endonuclease [Arthrobacter jinronghuae]
MKKKLPLEEQEGILDLLWAKSSGFCWLCQGTLNRASDTIVADHEIPESEGGPTDLANLNLAHSPCNSAKRAARTMDVRPYLRLVSYANKRRLKYDGYLKHFDINPASVVISRSGQNATIELPNGDTQECPIFAEKTPQKEFEYIFVSLPREAIFNDDDCQPRAIRPEHAWAIYGDLQRNPLHEPPSCRTETEALERPTRLLMFDGQHKTIATWMAGRDSVTAKVYLNLSSSAANELVNSIQAKIKKLPLSPFELAGKMSDEWQNKFQEYEKSVGSTDISEKGFIDWLPNTERTRGKQALHGALVQGILGDEGLRITNYVKKPSGPRESIEITEQALKTKIIEGLLIKDPQRSKGNDAQAARDREAENIIACLNRFSDLAFDVPEGSNRTPQESERGRRMVYQGSLAYISKLIRELWFHIACRSAEKNLMDDEFDENQWKLFQEGIDRLVNHPIWTAPWGDKPGLKTLQTGLEKNQASKELFEELGLSLTHLVMGNKDPQFRKHWS